MYSIGIGCIVYIIVRVRGPTPPWRSWFQGIQWGAPLNLGSVGFQGMCAVPELHRSNTSLLDLYHMRGGGIKLMISEHLWRKWKHLNFQEDRI